MKKSDILIALMAVGMCAACTHDGETIVNMGQEVVSPTNTNMPPELRLTYGAASTRAESNIQSSQFLSGERVNVYMRDVNGLDTYYPSSLNFTADGNGGLSRTSDNTRYYWPRQLGPLEIFGVYPENVLSTQKSGDTSPFTYSNEYWFTVAADQTDIANYKASDLMIGFPSNPSPNVAPCTLYQDGDEGTVNLNFTHRLTKIIVTLTPATWVAESGSIGQVTAEDLAYSTGGETPDTKYAKVTLCGIKRKISFKVYDASSDLGAAEATDDGNSTVVCLGSNNAFIVPPQTINTGTPFIKIELIDTTIESENKVYATFHYDLTTNLTLAAKNVYTYNITLEKPQIVVTVNDITAWTSGGEASTGSAGLVQ